ncbi:MAG: RNA polymerase sigma factor [Bacteroidetes bacterium]|nr:RNA polymerase sigma factor [Bacteroidota bacterium]
MEHSRDLFWTLHEPEHPRARAFCRKLAGNRDDGDDLYQDALVAALTGFGSLRDPDAFRPWLYRIIVNTFRNRLRRFHADRLRRFRDQSTSAPTEGFSATSPEAAYAARRRLELALRALSLEERALVTMFELDGWALAELTEVFGRSVGALKVRLFRARRKMRKAVLKQMTAEQQTANALTGKDEICVAGKPGEN